mgnify:CR=1 FL=1
MKRGEVKRGFNQFSKIVRDKATVAKQVANCKSCIYFDTEENCTNSNTSQYDMVTEEHRTYCCYWKGEAYDNGRRKKDFDW